MGVAALFLLKTFLEENLIVAVNYIHPVFQLLSIFIF